MQTPDTRCTSSSTELVCQLSTESSAASEARNLQILMEANQCRCATRYKTGPPVLPSHGNDFPAAFPLYKFIDDMTMFEVVSVPVIQTTTLQQEVDSFCQWATTNNMKLNVKKTKEFMVSFLKYTPQIDPLTVNNEPLQTVRTTKLLGVHLTSDLKWSAHIDYICAEASKRLYPLRTLRRSGVPSHDLCSVFCYFTRPILEYACPVWHSSLTLKLSDEIEAIQRRAVKIILPHLTYDGLSDLNLTTLFEEENTFADHSITKSLQTQ